MVIVMEEQQIIYQNNLLLNAKLNDYLKDNTIYLDCEVDRESQVLFCRQLRRLCERELKKKKEDRKPIKIYISSYGGVLVDYFAMASMILHYEEKGIIIETINMGYSCSAGFYLLILGTKGHRYSTRYGELLVHQIQCGQPYGSQTDMKERMNNIEENWEVLKSIMREHTNMTEEDITNLTAKNVDVIYSPQKAIEKGIVDKLI